MSKHYLERVGMCKNLYIEKKLQETDDPMCDTTILVGVRGKRYTREI